MDYDEAEYILTCLMDSLQRERERQGLSLQQLAALSGVSRTGIGMIEKGERSPSLIICLRLADTLGLRLGDALNAIPNKRKRK
jgi:transcriptional regulator with XRE-family HTH domain